MLKRINRSEVPVDLTWKTDDLFTSKDLWEAENIGIIEAAQTITQYKGKLATKASILLTALNERDVLLSRLIRISAYARLLQAEDGTNPSNQAVYAKMNSTSSKVNAYLSFIDPEIIQMSTRTIEQFIEQEAGLKVFHKRLKEIQIMKPYTLSSETEEALAALGDVLGSPGMIYRRSKASDMQFASIEGDNGELLPLSFPLYENSYESNPNTELRRKANQSFIRTLDQYKNTYAATYATEVQKQVALSRIRKFPSVTHMLLHSHQITHEMYHNQLDIIQNELAPHMRRYAKLKKRVLGLGNMYFHDLKVPLDPSYNPQITFEEATDLISEALQIMGPEYSQIIQKAINERWIDRAVNIGKSTGAFCTTPYGVHPYILITWVNSMRGAFTLSHELGHAGHFQLACTHQNYTNSRPSMYFIEAPSTMNELILGNHILSKSDNKQMKRWVILQLLGTYYHNFVTHLLEGEMQRRVYAHAELNEPITAQTLCEFKASILSNFWGDAVEIDHGASLTWMRQPHYYSGLYPYTYSAGLTASTAVFQLFQKEGQPAINRWLDILKAGGTMTPLEQLKYAGVDMSTPDPIRSAISYIGSLIDELEASYE